MDKETRNKLRSTVVHCRKILEEDVLDQLEGAFGIHRSGTIEPESALPHLDSEGLDARRRAVAAIEHIEGYDIKPRDAVDQFQREVAYTHLNRLCAFKMLERRDLLEETVSRGTNSNGFKVYLADHPEDERLWRSGKEYEAFKHFLFDVCAKLTDEIKVLFDTEHISSHLFPGRRALDDVLDLVNSVELADIWDSDETIGWIYQYFTPKELRDKARKESAAPRNSYELAFRNQFYTPRYVVQFLTDNTLGRTWYEMRKGETRLAEQCEYMVRRPTEIFLGPGEKPPAEPENGGDLSQEELLRQPVHIMHREKKLPWEIKVLDPASGSGHFLLYSFDLLETIYDEAFDDPDIGDRVRGFYPNRDDYNTRIPALILHHNMHGIDIDLRSTQIASLALWMRAQRSFQRMGLKGEARPRIEKANIVCAEPMPGDEALLDEFCDSLSPSVLGDLVRDVWQKMQLAGETGSLLKIEEEIRDVVKRAQDGWMKAPKAYRISLFEGTVERPPEQADFDFTDFTAPEFWERAETLLVEALRRFVGRAPNGSAYGRRLFRDDAEQGFAFIDLCRDRYDVVLMNPPFGDASLPSKSYLDGIYGDTKGDVYKAFVECFQTRLVPAGYLGIISSRTGFFLGQSEDWRTRVVLRLYRPIALADLGMGVLDAMVEVSAYVLRSLSEPEDRDLTLALVPALDRVVLDARERFSVPKWQVARDGLKRHQAIAELQRLEANGFVSRCEGDVSRYTPLWQAIKRVSEPRAPQFPPLLCFQALADDDKGCALSGAIAYVIEGKTTQSVFAAQPSQFAQLPGTPFAYWAGPAVRTLFRSLPVFQSGEREVRVGLQTSDDARFLRAWWEPDPVTYRSTWFPFAKGGSTRNFISEIVTLINWRDDGAELKEWASSMPGQSHWSRSIRSPDFYFRPGITWPLRASRFSPQLLPEGCIFSIRGQVAFAPEEDLTWMLGFLASSAFDLIYKTMLGRFGFPEFAGGVLQRLPIPMVSSTDKAALAALASDAWRERRDLQRCTPVLQWFMFPALVAETGATLAERASAWAARVRGGDDKVTAIQAEINDFVFRLYGLGTSDRTALTATGAAAESIDDASSASEEDEEDELGATASALTIDLLAYAVGSVLGRWDIRLAQGTVPRPDWPEPFESLPICPPGMLVGPDGLPAGPDAIVSKEWISARPDAVTIPPEGAVSRATVPMSEYPLRVDWDGILVDDSEHEDDIVRRVRDVLELLWSGEAPTIEQEACEILGLEELRDYFRNPKHFWDNHVRRYAKSRRKAPIYWLLQSPKRHYALWVYYHRLDKDIFFKALRNYVDPKLNREQNRLRELRDRLPGAVPGREQKALEKQIDDQETVVNDVRDFKERLERVAALGLDPDLNDGVILNIAPLHELVPWKEPKSYWDELLAGKYDWSTIGKQLRDKGLVRG